MTFKPHFSWDLLPRDEIRERSRRAYANNLDHITRRYAGERELPLLEPILRGEAPGVITTDGAEELFSVSSPPADAPACRTVFLSAEQGATPLTLEKSDMDRIAYDISLFLHMNGLNIEDRTLHVTDEPGASFQGLSIELGLNALQCNTLSIAPDTSRCGEILKAFRPTALVGPPQALSKIVSAHSGLLEKSLKRVFSVRSNLTHNLTAPPAPELEPLPVRNIICFPVISTAISECSAGSGYHIHPELCFCETADTGDLILTPFGIRSLPLARYAPGIRGTIDESPCTCGKTSPRITIHEHRSVAGQQDAPPTARKNDAPPLPQERKEALIAILKQDSRVRDFLLVVTEKSKGEEIHAYAVTDARKVSEIMAVIRKKTGESIPVLTSNQITLSGMRENSSSPNKYIYRS
ncbi:MAG: hypothetical protein ACQEQV_03500 [Fibrobacterota bacterium]